MERYDVRLSVDGGEWVMLPTVGPEVPLGQVPRSLDVDLLGGRRYAFSVMATDAEGNVGAWVDAPIVRPRILQEKNADIVWDPSWRFVTSSTASGGRLATTRQAGLIARLTGEWLAVGWVTTRSPRRGAVELSLDGIPVEAIDLGAPSLEMRHVAFTQTWSHAEPRELTIRTLYSPDRPRVDVDALIVLSPDGP